MWKPYVSSHVEKILRLSIQVRIFPGSECVARTPPIAALLSPWPDALRLSMTRTFRPLCASAQADGFPTLPEPTTMTS
jgi:hypothetical protein